MAVCLYPRAYPSCSIFASNWLSNLLFDREYSKMKASKMNAINMLQWQLHAIKTNALEQNNKLLHVESYIEKSISSKPKAVDPSK